MFRTTAFDVRTVIVFILQMRKYRPMAYIAIKSCVAKAYLFLRKVILDILLSGKASHAIEFYHIFIKKKIRCTYSHRERNLDVYQNVKSGFSC